MGKYIIIIKCSDFYVSDPMESIDDLLSKIKYFNQIKSNDFIPIQFYDNFYNL